MKDVWAVSGAYEAYVGRWSRPVAVAFVDWLGAPPQQRWLDIGCGTGALTSTILEHCDPSTVLGIDPSEAFVGAASAAVTDPRARFEVAEAAHAPPGVADVVVSGLVLNFVPDVDAALAAMRAAARGGVVAAYVWDYAGRMELMRHFWDAAVALDQSVAALDEGSRFPLCHPDRLAEAWHRAGLGDIATRPIDVTTVFRDFDDYWEPFLGGQGPAPTYVSSIDDDHRAALADALRARLPVEVDGSIPLVARAWAVRGCAR